MAMDSFFGGRQGASFVIVYKFDAIDVSKSGEQFRCKEAAISNTNPDLFLWENNNFVFKDGVNYDNYTWKYLSLDGGSVDTTAGSKVTPVEPAEGMVQCFAEGGDSTDKVNYGEYVIIDCPYKGNPDNGKVFRRGMNFIVSEDNPLAGAEYIGQIVGPKGDTPKVDMDHYEDIVGETGAVIDTLTVNGDDLIPGYDGTATNPYNDAIKYAYVNIKDQYNNIIGVMVGFQIPYLMVEYEARSITPYENRAVDPDTGEYYNYDLIEKDSNFIDQDGKWIHPFYQKWQMKIPGGVHGVNSTDIEIIPTRTRPVDSKNGYNGAYIYTKSTCKENEHATTTPAGGGWLILADYELAQNLGTSATPEGYMGETDGVKWVRFTYTDGRILYVKQEDCYCYIIKYKETNFDNIAEGEKSYFTIGEKKDIQKIILSEDGYITIYYSSADGKEVLDNVLRWIHYDPSNPNVSGITINTEGTVRVFYNTFTRNPETGALERDVQVFEHIAGWIDEVKLENNGTLTFEYNNGTDPIVFEKKVQWINNVQIETAVVGGDEGSGDQYVHVIYNNDDVQTIAASNRIGRPINYIIDTVVSKGNTSAGIPHSHLLVYYSDPAKRAALGESYSYFSPKLNKNVTGWVDLGNVQGEPGGIHNIKEIKSLSELVDASGRWIPPENIVPGRLDYAGWSVTLVDYTYEPTTSSDTNALLVVANGVTPTASQVRVSEANASAPAGTTYVVGDYVKKVYNENFPQQILFYDYEMKVWNPVGSIDSSSTEPNTVVVTSKAGDNDLPATSETSTLRPNGFWFAQKSMKSVH